MLILNDEGTKQEWVFTHLKRAEQKHVSLYLFYWSDWFMSNQSYLGSENNKKFSGLCPLEITVRNLKIKTSEKEKASLPYVNGGNRKLLF